MEHISRQEAKDLLVMPTKRTKYGSKAVWVDGLYFQSKREAKRWCELRVLADLGSIKHLRRQVPFALHANGVKITSYRADFVYENEGGALCVEDAKGLVTDLFRIKAKWMKAQHGIEVRQV